VHARISLLSFNVFPSFSLVALIATFFLPMRRRFLPSSRQMAKLIAEAKYRRRDAIFQRPKATNDEKGKEIKILPLYSATNYYTTAIIATTVVQTVDDYSCSISQQNVS